MDELEAVHVERLTDATVATPTQVFIVRKGARPRGEPAFSADHVDGLRLTWRDARTLNVAADFARPFREEASEKIGAATVAITYSYRARQDPKGPEVEYTANGVVRLR